MFYDFVFVPLQLTKSTCKNMSDVKNYLICIKYLIFNLKMFNKKSSHPQNHGLKLKIIILLNFELHTKICTIDNF